MSKSVLMDNSKAEQDKAIAEAIGLTEEEMAELEYTMDEEKSSDGGIAYSYVIQFDDNCPKEILSKIEGLEDGNWVRIDSNIFDNSGN